MALLSKAITGVANYLNVGKNLTVPQAREIAQLTLKEHWYLTENQLILLTQRIKLGKYPQVKILDTFDGLKWFEYIAIFNEEIRLERKKKEDEERQEMYKRWSEEKKADPPKPETIEKAKTLYKKIIKPQVEIEQTEQSKLVNEWDREFRQLYRGNGDNGFIEYEGKKLNSKEFLDLKYTRYLESL